MDYKNALLYVEHFFYLYVMKRIALTFATILFGISLVAQTINSETSKITFEISNMGFNTVKGDINGMKGVINFNDNDLSKSTFNVCLDVKTINTGNSERDTHLKNPDFFDVDKYPTVCFKSKAVTMSGSKHFKYTVVGDLTIYGVTKEEKINFTKEGNKFVGKMKVNRFDYHLGVEEYDGTFMVGDEVGVDIICEVK